APGANDKVYGFGLVDWCEGWFDGRLAPGRTADVFCAQVRAAVARSRARGRLALVIVDNLRTHTPAGSKLVRQMLAELQDHLRIIYTPAYDPDEPRSPRRPRYAFRGGLSGAGAPSTDSSTAANIERGFCPKKRSAAVVPSDRVRKKLCTAVRHARFLGWSSPRR